jgi:hypothetical protein
MGIPTAIFCGNRPEHTERLLSSLYRCRDIDQLNIHVFCDGAHDEEDAPAVEDTQQRVINCDLPVFTCHFSREQQGATKQLIDGVNLLLEDHECVIVLADGMLLAPHCISYLIQALNRYADSPHLMQVSGWSYPIPPSNDCYSLRLAETWVWGTWKRAWERFEDNAERLHQRLESCGKLDEFNLGGAHNFGHILLDQARGAVGSWAILWYASMFLNNGLCLYPGQTLARRKDPQDPFGSELAIDPVVLPDAAPAESDEVRQAVTEFYRTLNSSTVATKTRNLLRRLRRH